MIELHVPSVLSSTAVLCLNVYTNHLYHTI